jgi:hypothetical protein
MKKITSLFFLSLFVSFATNAQGTWNQKADLGGVSRWAAAGFSIGTKGYVSTGRSGSAFLSDCWEYDNVNDAWTQKADFAGGARFFAVGFSIGNKGYIATGDTAALTGHKNDMWEFDAMGNTWTRKSDLPGDGRFGAVGFSIGSKAYVGTGYNSSALVDFWEWDQSTDTWQNIQDEFTADFSARFLAVGFSIGGKGYIGTGSTYFSSSSAKSDFWELDTATKAWTRKADFAGTARYGAGGFSMNTQGYIGGGNAGSAQYDFWEWDQAADVWTSKSDYPNGTIMFPVAFSIGNKGYFATGSPTVAFSGSGNKNVFEFSDTCAGFVVGDTLPPFLCDGETGFIDVTTYGGTPPYSFLWNTGETTEDLTGIPSGYYSLTATDANGCAVLKWEILNPSPAIDAALYTVDNSCHGDASGEIVLGISSGLQPYTFLWSNGATTQDLTGLNGGTYSVTITDAVGCTLVADTTINEHAAVVIITDSLKNASSCSVNDGAIYTTVSGGTTPYVLQWNIGNGTTDQTNLATGDYLFEVFDANSCYTKDTFTITAPGVPVVVIDSVHNANCYGDYNGEIFISVSGGAPGYSYYWNVFPFQTNEDATNLPANSYYVIVTDAAQCHVTAYATVTQPSYISDSTIIENPSCFNLADGAITIYPKGGTPPFSFQWDAAAANQVTQTANNLSAGVYTVAIADSHGCVDTIEKTVTNPDVLSIDYFEPNNIHCNGENNGWFYVTVSGGTPDYVYFWENGITSDTVIKSYYGQTFSELSPGTYTVSVTDINFCPADTVIVTLTEPSAITLVMSHTDVTCNGGQDGTATVLALGGTGFYYYYWNDPMGQSMDVAISLAAGSYTVDINDNSGCFTIDTVTITEPPALGIQFQVSNTSSCGVSDGTINSIVSGGVSPYSYLWETSETTASIASLSTGMYSLSITDSVGCVHIDSAYVDCSIGISGTQQETSLLSVYPNPTSGQIAIDYISQGNNMEVSIRIIDASGREVYSEHVKNFGGHYERKIALDNFGRGIYFVQLLNNGNVITKKVVVD